MYERAPPWAPFSQTNRGGDAVQGPANAFLVFIREAAHRIARALLFALENICLSSLENAFVSSLDLKIEQTKDRASPVHIVNFLPSFVSTYLAVAVSVSVSIFISVFRA